MTFTLFSFTRITPLSVFLALPGEWILNHRAVLGLPGHLSIEDVTPRNEEVFEEIFQPGDVIGADTNVVKQGINNIMKYLPLAGFAALL